jgi:DNA-binding transcriptional ArsR family regulator
MKDELVLKDIAQIKALADPLRLQVLEAFCQKPMTTKQVAILLEQNPTKLYHHVDILEKAGLIRLVKTQQNRGTVEKYYQGVARRIAVSQILANSPSEAGSPRDELLKALTSALEATMSEIRKSVSAKLIKRGEPGRKAIVARVHVITTQDKGEKLFERITEWMHECHDFGDRRGDMTYGLTVAFYPVKKKKATSKSSRHSETDEAEKS